MSYFLLVLLGLAALTSAVTIEKADREFDLTGHLLKIEDKILFLGSDKATTEVEYFLAGDLGDKVAYFDASAKTGDKRERLVVTEQKEKSNGRKVWKIKLAQSLGNNERANVIVNIVFTGALQPYPRKIKQNERQKILFSGNVHLLSAYPIKSETVRFNLATPQIESYTKSKPVSVSENVITYGPYENVQPFTESEVAVHFENNKPFLAVRKMTRIVDVSLWGSNIAIEEHYEIYHNGAELNGPFSRYDYQIHQDGISSIKSFKTVLPAAARDIYYRDEIGNISTSNVRTLSDAVEIEIRPRFPLFGGWKTVYYIGYNVPAHQFLYRTGGHFALKMPLVDHVYDDQLIEDFTIKVILPESSEILKFYPPYSVERRPNEARNVYFDFTDSIVRPIFVASTKNLVEQHIQDFTLEFNFRSILLFRQPLLFTTAFLALFFTVIILVRMDFAITRDEAAEARMKASSHSEGIMRQVKSLHSNYEAFNGALNNYKTTKDVNAFAGARKKMETSVGEAREELQAIRETMKSEGLELADKIAELIKQDTLIRDLLAKQASSVERFVKGNTDKAKFTQEEEDLRNQLRDLVSRFDHVAALFA